MTCIRHLRTLALSTRKHHETNNRLWGVDDVEACMLRKSPRTPLYVVPARTLDNENGVVMRRMDGNRNTIPLKKLQIQAVLFCQKDRVSKIVR